MTRQRPLRITFFAFRVSYTGLCHPASLNMYAAIFVALGLMPHTTEGDASQGGAGLRAGGRCKKVLLGERAVADVRLGTV